MHMWIFSPAQALLLASMVGISRDVRGEAKAFAIQLHHELEYLADLASSVTRRGLGQSYGVFQSNFRGALKPIAAEFDKLNVRMRAPGWGVV
jgi:hypothetical protein